MNKDEFLSLYDNNHIFSFQELRYILYSFEPIIDTREETDIPTSVIIFKIHKRYFIILIKEYTIIEQPIEVTSEIQIVSLNIFRNKKTKDIIYIK